MPKLTLFSPEKEYSQTVLIVEDDEIDYELALRSFQDSKFANDVIWLDSGEKLVDYLLSRNDYAELGHSNPVLIFLDINMPRLNGKETLEKLEKYRDISDLRIVLLTNSDKEQVDSMGLAKMPFIQKPLTFEKMYDYIINWRHFLFE